MAEREKDSRLEELRNSGETIYSISRLGTFNNCLAEAYKTYVLHEKGRDNIYGSLGTRIHDTLEAIVNDKATEADLLPAMNNELEDMNLLGIEFPKDSNGNDTLKNNWIADMTHFCKTYKSPKKNLHTEELFIYKTPKGRYLQGYIDLYRDNSDGSISIFDYKTSSMYKGTDLVEHGYQLVLYALGKEQEGTPVKSVSWIFLKYVDISFMGKKTVKSKDKTEIVKAIERRKIGSEMKKYVEQDLYEAGMDELDAEVILQEFVDTNDFNVLPAEIRDNYKMKPCVFNYELTDEVKHQCIEYIDNTIDMWESLDKSDESIFIPRNFTKIQKNGKVVSDVFYCCSLCQHGHRCQYLHDFLETHNNQDDTDEDLF